MYIIPAMALKRGRQIKGTAKHKGAKGQVTRKMTRTKRSKPKLKPSIEISIKNVGLYYTQSQRSVCSPVGNGFRNTHHP
jgi:hypothetical protein